MQTNLLEPHKVLNKVYFNTKIIRTEMDNFKIQMIVLLDAINEKETEEFHKNLVRDFLKQTFYNPNYFVNTKGRNDLVIHNSKDAKTTVGVIIEAKSPVNKAEMITTNNLNGKALQELVLYYLRERITHKNTDLKQLIVTNIYEWFIFDAHIFNKLFADDKKFVAKFIDFEEKRASGKTTDFFYNDIAKPFIETIKTELQYTYFDIRVYEKPLRNEDKEDDKLLVALFKLLSPEHLMKLPFANDSNTLDRGFYEELLHIIGLTEVKENGKNLIQRKKSAHQNEGSLLENAIQQLESMDKINRLPNSKQYGQSYEDKLFGVGLELCITWINRILFLKLLEAQLITYHKGDKNYSFLNLNLIKNYGDLNKLFFQVLAEKPENRNKTIAQIFENVPYLNSSLFIATDLEHSSLTIANLDSGATLPLLPNTVIKDNLKKKTGRLNALEYLFSFLDAYNFATDVNESFQENDKKLINAAVLGLIFEKINGYKDGSFFTPSFITMYMCKESIRRAVVQKFSHISSESGNMETYEDVKAYCNHFYKKEDKIAYNKLINSVKICDPAVGSGHFLVSALNEIIAIKNDLGILMDKNGLGLKIDIEIVNDELIITNENRLIIQYNPKSKDSQRIQETLFHEKQTIIENCLFGVDINPNSVKICQLRLWIELLKNAYYHPNTKQLETLPNIDINIKCGNSLISRFGIDADLKKALKSGKYSIDAYKIAVERYQNATSKEEKRQMEAIIEEVKSNFTTEIASNDPLKLKTEKLNGELVKLTTQTGLFELDKKQKAIWDSEIYTITTEIKDLDRKIEFKKSNKIFDRSFEWRFEFPQVLSNDGDFIGFDVVVTNPPYFSISTMEPDLQNYYESAYYKTFVKSADIYCLFMELAKNIGSKTGLNHFIISNKWLTANYGIKTRAFLAKNTSSISLIDFNNYKVFDQAAVDTCLVSYSNKNGMINDFIEFDLKEKEEDIEIFLLNINKSVKTISLKDNWNVSGFEFNSIKEKVELKGKCLINWDININYGIKTGLNEAFVITEVQKNNIIKKNKKATNLIHPILRGRDIQKYYADFKNLYLINIPKGFTIKSILKSKNEKLIQSIENGDFKSNEIWDWFDEEYSEISNHLISFKEKAIQRTDSGDFWWELRACTYLESFFEEKIIYKDISQKLTFMIDKNHYFTNNTNYFITKNKSKDINLNYLTAILNSSLINFYYRLISTQLGEAAVRLFTQFVEKIPVVEPSDKQQINISKIVDKILSLKQANPQADTLALEQDIDAMVYQLYGLNDKEIMIVEGK